MMKAFLVISKNGYAEVVKATSEEAAGRQVWGTVRVVTLKEMAFFLNRMAVIEHKPMVDEQEYDNGKE